MKSIGNPSVLAKFNSYPKTIRPKLLFLRQLVLETAETLNVSKLEERLKWGEPSYKAKDGSPIRMDWKERTPDQYALYFICSTTLVTTYKEIYSDLFTFDGNRAIIFHKDDPIAINELKHCIGLALRYHQIKHLPMLGV